MSNVHSFSHEGKTSPAFFVIDLLKSKSIFMKDLLAVMLLLCCGALNAQNVCGTANEGGTVTLTAPAGNVFISIVFASYGTPNGSCGSFTVGACHAANSQSIVEGVFLGQNSASINATNTVFGDPCSGTAKRLYIEATYAATLPLRLLSLSATTNAKGEVQLNWSTADEQQTSHFLIEYSTNGREFQSLNRVAAKGNGAAVYSSSQKIAAAVPVIYFRLKMVDVDGKYTYSQIVAVRSATKLSLSAVCYNNLLTVNSRIRQELYLLNTSGQVIKKFIVQPGFVQLSVLELATGVYFLKGSDAVVKFVKQ